MPHVDDSSDSIVSAPSHLGNAVTLDRQPPCNLQAEMAVLGSILLRPDVLDEVVMVLRPDDFYDEAHRKLYRHMVGMHDAGKKIDVTLLVDELRRQGDFDAIGGAAFLARVGNSVATAAHANYYADIVRQDATCRALINSCTEILQEAYQPESNAQELLSRAEQRIFSILERGESSSLSDIRDILHEAMDRIDARMKGEHQAGGVETGFTEFDNLTGGLHNSELIILAARPSMGKTALAMNIAEYVAMKLKIAGAVRQPGNVVNRIGRPHAVLRRRSQRSPSAQRHDLERRPQAAGRNRGQDERVPVVCRRFAQPHGQRNRRRRAADQAA